MIMHVDEKRSRGLKENLRVKGVDCTLTANRSE